MSLAARHHPKTFEEVVGQDATVDLLRRLVCKERSGILLVGPTGCGKSALASLYAGSLLCTKFTGWERCLCCRDCRSFEIDMHPNLRTLELGADRDEVIAAEIIAEVASEILSDGWQVYILDRVDHRSSGALDVLRTRLERTPQKIAFVACAEEARDVPEWLRTSLFEIVVDYVDGAACFDLLRRVAKDEGIETADEALLMIAERSGGCVRGALRDLEVLSVKGSVTLGAVKAYHHIPLENDLRQYLDALIESDIDKQIDIVAAWPGPVRAKMQMVGDLLVDIFSQRRALSRPSLGEYLPKNLLNSYAVKLSAKAQAVGISERVLWNGLRDIWRPDLSVSQASLFRKLYLVHALFDEDSTGVAAHLDAVDDKRSAPPLRRVRSYTPSSTLEALNERQMEKIWAASTFMVQQYGVLFNTRITLRYDLLGIVEHNEAGAFLGALTHELGQLVDNRVGISRFHWVYIHELANGGLQTHIAAHIPICVDAVRFWLRSFILRRGAVSASRAVMCQIIGNGGLGSLRRHAFMLKLLCRGLSPSCCTVGLHKRSLLDALQIPTRLREVSRELPFAQRYRVSISLGQTAQRRATIMGFPPLSPIRARAWSWLYKAWELEEYKTRVELQKNRQSDEQTLVAQWPKMKSRMIDQRRDRELERLKKDWKSQGEARVVMWQRTWAKSSK